MKPHPYRLRAYHNPENVPFEAIPQGWRFLYVDEIGIKPNRPFMTFVDSPRRWAYRGLLFQPNWTYIVPIAAGSHENSATPTQL